MVLTASELRALGLARWGPEWQSPLARALRVSARTVRRWAAGTVAIPEGAAEEIFVLFGGTPGTLILPRSEWLIAEGADDEDDHRLYVVHARRPRFIARIIRVIAGTLEADPDEAPADTLAGITAGIDEEHELAEIAWIDPPPVERLLETLITEAVERAALFLQDEELA